MTVKKYYNLAKNILFPICRSITGKGTLKTLKLIKKEFKDLKIKKIKSGKKFLIGSFHQSGISKKHILLIKME